ncbi:MAG: 4a-hydroxytetrahydrobiopterin dehydratase [Planctomycetes bacterium]|nr:4a-hydroxytetrahydrobiopterin dehydratase [Planctomycetota bacterium]
MLRVLSDRELDEALASLPGWTRRAHAIAATFTFRDFAQAFAFMTKVAAAAEVQNHHPDWRNCWSRVDITLSTHDAGGVTARDLALARSIQDIAPAAR